MTFIPEFYNGVHVNATEEAFAKTWSDISGWVVTFNEPWGETAMTVSNAIAAWPGVQSIGAKIVAPSISWGNATAQTWMSDFDAAITSNGYHYDAINEHCVTGVRTGNGDPIGLANTCLTRMDQFHAAYPNKEMWATEVELLTTNDAAGAAEAKKFYSVVVPGMESRSYITHYAGWPATADPEGSGGTGVPDFSAISMTDASGNLTSVGTYWTQLSPHN